MKDHRIHNKIFIMLLCLALFFAGMPEQAFAASVSFASFEETVSATDDCENSEENADDCDNSEESVDDYNNSEEIVDDCENSEETMDDSDNLEESKVDSECADDSAAAEIGIDWEDLYPADLMQPEWEYIPYEEVCQEFPDEQLAAAASITSDDQFFVSAASITSDEQFLVSAASITSDEQLLTSAYYESEWEQYGCYYVYNLLSEDDKLIWDELNALCVAALENEDNRQTTGFVSIGRTDTDHVKNVVYMFRYCNPQYFFLKNAFTYTYKKTDPSTIYVGIGIYDNFQDGTARKEAAEQFFAQLSEWEIELEDYDTDLEKILKIQDLICQKVAYDYEFASLTSDKQKETEKTSYTQSAYSVLCMDKTVCAGYAQSFELLANAAGIDAIAVTSSSHEWNQVRLEDSWYNIDCTWADKDTYVWQKYTLKSDDYYESDNSSHIRSSFWDGYTPPCTQDSTFSGSSDVGTLPEGSVPEPLGTADAPVISCKGVTDLLVTIRCAISGAQVYYTVNGKEASSAYTKSLLYEEPFTAQAGDIIRAVAVANGYYDSNQVTVVAEPPVYEITYILDGGTNAAENPATYKEGDCVVSLTDPEKTGYTFQGWYADPEFTKPVTEIDTSLCEDLTLYASWKILTFQVTFDTAGVKEEETVSYEYGQRITAPEIKREGYTLTGWNVQSVQETAWDFEQDLVTQDMILVAVWEPAHYLVSFDAGQGTAEKLEIEVVYGQPYGELPEAVQDGFHFDGWYLEGSEQRMSADMIVSYAGDHTLCARWITWSTCSSPVSDVLSGSVVDGTQITLSTTTEGAKIYYTTDGSLPDSEKGICYAEPICVTEDMILRAIAVNDGYKDSFVSSYSYKVLTYSFDRGDITAEDLKEYADTLGVDVYAMTEDMLPSGLWIANLQDKMYTGQKITCPEMHVYYGTKRLTEGQDYKVTYSSNRSSGTAKVTVKGKGSSKGTCKATFTILAVDLSEAQVEDIVLDYTGKLQKGKPAVYVISNGKKMKLKAGRDFVYEYPRTDAKSADYDKNAFRSEGTYKIIIQGKGNYQGSIEVTETIGRTAAVTQTVAAELSAEKIYETILLVKRLMVWLFS